MIARTGEFNGSFLMRWKGKTDAEPILIMNHQDVVETSGACAGGRFLPIYLKRGVMDTLYNHQIVRRNGTPCVPFFTLI